VCAWDGLTYRYPTIERAALDAVSFDVAAGERVAIIGPDGSGQSTLLHVLAGLKPGYTGAVRFDGITLHDLDPAALRDRMGLVLSSADIFEGTVEENITLGRPGIGPAEVLVALDCVGAADAVQAMERGLSTLLTNGARGLPSTLRVRLLVARAIGGLAAPGAGGRMSSRSSSRARVVSWWRPSPRAVRRGPCSW
jgi:ATP-binding cassette subfamily B protein